MGVDLSVADAETLLLRNEPLRRRGGYRFMTVSCGSLGWRWAEAAEHVHWLASWVVCAVSYRYW